MDTGFEDFGNLKGIITRAAHVFAYHAKKEKSTKNIHRDLMGQHSPRRTSQKQKNLQV